MQMMWCYWLAMKDYPGRLVESYVEVCERSCLKGKREDSRQRRGTESVCNVQINVKEEGFTG